jgi:hypothetical protein
MSNKQLSPPVVLAALVIAVVLVIGFGVVYLNKSSGGGSDWGVKKSGLPPGMRGKQDQMANQPGGASPMPTPASKN